MAHLNLTPVIYTKLIFLWIKFQSLMMPTQNLHLLSPNTHQTIAVCVAFLWLLTLLFAHVTEYRCIEIWNKWIQSISCICNKPKKKFSHWKDLIKVECIHHQKKKSINTCASGYWLSNASPMNATSANITKNTAYIMANTVAKYRLAILSKKKELKIGNEFNNFYQFHACPMWGLKSCIFFYINLVKPST